ncbi:Metaxin-2-like protein [Aphelenchoides fujianensis]|nr:Metaxin-2-like protein [Aphelenchoides fujianensis]
MSETGASSAAPNWKDAELFCPYQHEQALLYEYASIVATRTFLKMVSLPVNIEQRPNAEFMSPNRSVPFLRLQPTLVSGFSNIVEFIAQKGIKLTNTLSEPEVADMQALISLVSETLVRAEMYVCWKDTPTYLQVTRHRYGSVYVFPLSWILPPLKRRELLAHLKNVGWAHLTMDEVVKKCNACFHALSIKLGDRKYMMGAEPTELDALAFGHIYSILTIELPSMHLANTLRKYTNLVKYCSAIDKEYFEFPASSQ